MNPRQQLSWRVQQNLHSRGPQSIEDIHAREPDVTRGDVLGALAFLESRRWSEYDPETQTHRLTKAGHRVFSMSHKKRRPKPAPTPAQVAPVLNMARERDRLVVEFGGPFALAEECVEDDPVLFERLATARLAGLDPFDLTSTPRHRRPAEVERILDEFAEATRGGPCDWCGSTVQRRGTFTIRKDRRACGWCNSWLQAHDGNTDLLREAVFNAVVGTMGFPLVGSYRSAPSITPFAHEANEFGEAWGHLSEVHREAMRLRARQVVHPSRYVLTEGARREVSLLDLPAPIHDWADLPKVPVTWFTVKKDQERWRKEQAEFESRQAADAERRKVQQANHLHDVERNARARQAMEGLG